LPSADTAASVAARPSCPHGGRRMLSSGSSSASMVLWVAGAGQSGCTALRARPWRACAVLPPAGRRLPLRRLLPSHAAAQGLAALQSCGMQRYLRRWATRLLAVASVGADHRLLLVAAGRRGQRYACRLRLLVRSLLHLRLLAPDPQLFGQLWHGSSKRSCSTCRASNVGFCMSAEYACVRDDGRMPDPSEQVPLHVLFVCTSIYDRHAPADIRPLVMHTEQLRAASPDQGPPQSLLPTI